LYNWPADSVENFVNQTARLLSWVGLRVHTLNTVLHQKMGLFHHVTPSQSLMAGVAPAVGPPVVITLTELVSHAFPPMSAAAANATVAGARRSAQLPAAALQVPALAPELKIYPPPEPMQHTDLMSLVDPVQRHGTQYLRLCELHRARVRPLLN